MPQDYIVFGNGWFDVEKDGNGFFIWSSKLSELYINKNVKSIELVFGLFGYDSNILEIYNGNTLINQLNIVDKLNSIKLDGCGGAVLKIGSNTFNPSKKKIGSNDTRDLGYRFYKFIVDTGFEKVEVPLIDITRKLVNVVDINSKYNSPILLDDTEWNEVEYILDKNGNRHNFIWSKSQFTVSFNSGYSKFEFLIEKTPVSDEIRVVDDNKKEFIIKLVDALTLVSIPIENLKQLTFTCNPYIPKNYSETLTDTRLLGIRFIKFWAVDAKGEKIEIPISFLIFKNLYNLYKNSERKTGLSIKNATQNSMYDTDDFSDNKMGKLNLDTQIAFYTHRSGWNYVVKALSPLHNKNGVLFNGFLEDAFCWRRVEYTLSKKLPYTVPWVGFFHNPPNMPAFFDDRAASPTSMMNTEEFKQSLPYNLGFFALSKYHANFIKEFTNKPVNWFYHPTEFTDKIFNYKNFLNNRNKKILTVGWWLRKLCDINILKVDNTLYKKYTISFKDKTNVAVTRMLAFEKSINNICLTDEEEKSVNYIDYMSDDEYDTFMTKNIIFLSLYDSSSNNSIIECIVRGTPILVNPLPAVIEYLGENYPFYFTNLKEASDKLHNMELIKTTHEYLMNCPTRNKLKIEYFMESFLNCEIYKSL